MVYSRVFVSFIVNEVFGNNNSYFSITNGGVIDSPRITGAVTATTFRAERCGEMNNSQNNVNHDSFWKVRVAFEFDESIQTINGFISALRNIFGEGRNEQTGIINNSSYHQQYYCEMLDDLVRNPSMFHRMEYVNY